LTVPGSRPLASRESPGDLALVALRQAGLAGLCSLAVVVVTAVIGNAWLSADKLWHVTGIAQAGLVAWPVALGGSWQVGVSAPIPGLSILSSGVTISILTGTLGVPWNLLTLELIGAAALIAWRGRATNPFLLGIATCTVTLLIGILATAVISHISGVDLTAGPSPALSSLGSQPIVTAQPGFGFSWIMTAVGVGLASTWGAMANGRSRYRLSSGRVLDLGRIIGAALLALSLAGGVSWLVVLVAGLVDPSFARATVMQPSLWLLGGPAWMVQGLGMAAGASMRVQETVVGVGLSENLGLFSRNHAAFNTSVILAAVTIVSGFVAGRWWRRRANHSRLGEALLIGLVFSGVLAILAAGSGFSVSAELSAGVAGIAGDVLGGVLGLVPLVGPLLSGLSSGLFTAAHSEGAQVAWGVNPFGLVLGSVLLVDVGALLGALSTRPRRSAPSGRDNKGSTGPARFILPQPTERAALGAGPVSRSVDHPVGSGLTSAEVSVTRAGGTASVQRTVCALCRAVETKGAENCGECGARL